MGKLKNKIDFALLVSVNKANANGDPLNGNRPRTDYEGYGEMSDVCIKRKIRNRMQDMGNNIFVQSEERCKDKFKSLKERAEYYLKDVSRNEYAAKACAEWLDVRSFGQVFAFKSKDDISKGVSVGVRGPVSIHQAVSVSPIEVRSIQITKSVNGEDTKTEDELSSDRMGTKHFVQFGLYEIKGSVNVQLAEKTGFSEDDVEVLKECLRTLFVNDASSARPEGSMEILKLYWWVHNCKEGQYPSAKVHRSLKIKLKDENKIPKSVYDYDITLDNLEGLVPEEIEGI